MTRLPISIAGFILLGCVTSAEVFAAGDPQAAKAKVPLCLGCHGLNGEGKDPTQGQPAFPALAGQREAYFIKAINEYKNGDRKDPLMGAIAKALTDADVANLAAYYATLGK